MMIDVPEAPLSTAWEDVRAWRKQMREALIAYRTGLAPHLRRSQGEQAKRRLTQSVNLRQFETLGIYWPIKGEINIRDLVLRHVEAGGRVALPVVVARASPWSSGVGNLACE
jgi:5-formyltetrahydrofolate cyclo-ligase